MALDPTRRAITFDGRPAVNVSVLWVQQRLNALLAGRAVPLVEDGVWGMNTQSAGAQYLLTVLGVDRATGMLRGESYEGTVDPASSRRAIVTPALERAFAGESAVTPEPESGGGATFAVGIAALASLGLYMATRSRGGGMRGVDLEEKLREAKRERAQRGSYEDFLEQRQARVRFSAPTTAAEAREQVQRHEAAMWRYNKARQDAHGMITDEKANQKFFAHFDEAQRLRRLVGRGVLRGFGGGKLSSEQRRTMEVTNSIAAARHGLKEKDWPSVEYAIHRLRALKSPSAEQYQAQYDAARSGGLKGFRLPGFKRPPREGTRVVFDPNPASMALYSSHPRIGEGGTVKPVAMGGGRRAVSMRGPGGGLVYVDWDESRFQGVSLHDLSKEG